MRAQDVVIGEYYRHKDHPAIGWAKAVKVLRPRTGVNTTSRIVVECEWATDKSGVFGLVKHFQPSDLMRAGLE